MSVKECCVTCFKWHFRDDVMERYFYTDTLKECQERIKKTYRCKDEDFVITAIQKRNNITNKIIEEVNLFEQESLSLVW